METNNLPDSEFKTVLIRKLSEVSENLNIKKDVEIVKKNQSEMKDALTEMNNLQGINNRVDKAENQISNWE